MLYLQKAEINTLVLNVNNNSRETFTGYTLTFKHILSQETKSYQVAVDSPDFFENIRYCTFTLAFNVDDLNYEGQYQLDIFGNGGSPVANEQVYTGMVILEGTYEQGNTFTEYISPNEDNDNFIYIQE